MRALPKVAAPIVLAATLVIVPSAAGGLKVGDVAPAFSLQASDGKQYTLANYKGKQVVVLAWFAKAFSSA